MSDQISQHYDEDYYEWQKSVGEFGGWANLPKFRQWIQSTTRVLDFGCGGGFLLSKLQCEYKCGVEINAAAAKEAKSKGFDVFENVREVGDESVDLVISNHALEHTLRPLDELKQLARKLVVGGRIVIVVPCEAISMRYEPGDVNHHLYTWSPMCLGNLLTEAGFEVEESLPFMHKWPPGHRQIARFGGRSVFDIACKLYARVARSSFQVRAVGIKLS